MCAGAGRYSGTRGRGTTGTKTTTYTYIYIYTTRCGCTGEKRVHAHSASQTNYRAKCTSERGKRERKRCTRARNSKRRRRHQVLVDLLNLRKIMTTTSEAAKLELQVEQTSTDIQEADSNVRCESPKRGTTLSTSTSSFEPLDPHDPNLSRLANTMFQKTSEYLQEELTATHADYKLLERMNKETIAKYAELKSISLNVSQYLDTINQNYKKLQPVLDNINQIDDSVTKLEQAAYKLLAYSNRLEAKFKDIEKESKK